MEEPFLEGVPRRMIIAQSDLELIDWLLGIKNNKPNEAGTFLKSVAEAGLRADPDNYLAMRPFLLKMKRKYPTYCDPDPSRRLETRQG